jgi:hypothetical protein
MDEPNKVREAASDLAEGVRSAAGAVVGKAAQAVDSLTGKAGDAGSEEVLRAEDATPDREIAPDPGNRTGVRDTAGDTTDHA